MTDFDSVSIHNQTANQYDQQASKQGWFGHDVLFGMCFEYIQPHERLLDIGIGTGLASMPFAKAGLEIYGCDGSTEMLKICEAKAFAKELKALQLHNCRLPYTDSFFNHVICSGVLHFFNNLDKILQEIFRVIKPGGIFAFTVAALPCDEEAAMKDKYQGFIEAPTPWRVSIFKHSNDYIHTLLQSNNYVILKNQKLLVREGPEDDHEDMQFNVYISRKDENMHLTI